METPEEACIVLYAVPFKGECVSRTPTWKDGQNHVLLDLTDQSRWVTVEGLDERGACRRVLNYRVAPLNTGSV